MEVLNHLEIGRLAGSRKELGGFKLLKSALRVKSICVERGKASEMISEVEQGFIILRLFGYKAGEGQS